MSPPRQTPIGLELAGVARDVGRAFDVALTAAGGSRPTWLVLLCVKGRPTANQRELAAAVGIQGATLTHHLNGMEADGLLTRRRDPENRRVHLVELTGPGEEMFLRLRTVAATHDTQLRRDLADGEIATLRALLGRLRANVVEPA